MVREPFSIVRSLRPLTHCWHSWCRIDDISTLNILIFYFHSFVVCRNLADENAFYEAKICIEIIIAKVFRSKFLSVFNVCAKRMDRHTSTQNKVCETTDDGREKKKKTSRFMFR